MIRTLLSLAFLSVIITACDAQLEDPRIANIEYSKKQVTTIETLARTREGEQKKCVDEFLADYSTSVYDHCEATGYARDIAGGCGHVVFYAKTPTVKWEALKKCGIKTKI